MVNVRKIVKKIVPRRLFGGIEPYGHLLEAVVANVRYGFPSKNMHIIGVTGTNGKTTTSFMIHKMLTEAGYKTAFMSTVAYGVGDDIRQQAEHITTAQAGVLQKRLREFKQAGVEWLILETSSHSLAQYRTWGVPYEIAVMTNVTNDHLDYHRTFARYLAAKKRLFEIANQHKHGFGVVNADDPNSTEFSRSIANSISYGIKGGDLIASEIDLRSDNSVFKVKADDDIYNIKLNIPGEFNISNGLAAIAVGRHIGLNITQIEKGLAALSGVEGRMTVINRGQIFKVIVDFASTPDAFERLFESVRPVTKGKLVAVFGSAGRRDEAKRSVQGEIAGKYCDEIILTEEDDRDIDGHEILTQIAAGANKAGKVENKDMFLILDRRQAIEFALGRVTSPDDTLVLLGKGHEKTIERTDGAHPWDEIKVTCQLIDNKLK